MPPVSYWPDSERWGRYWPASIVAVIAVIQLLISFLIVGLQFGIVIIGVAFLCNDVTARYIMGFVCWAFFVACWISILCVTCCNRSSVGCATYTLIKNILAFIFSAVLIDFDHKFINNPLFDYTYNGLSGTVGNTPDSCSQSLSGTETNFWEVSKSLSQGQLAGAVIILVTSLIFIGIYIYVYIRALSADKNVFKNVPWGPNRITSVPPTYTGDFVLRQPSSNISPATEFNSDPIRSPDGIETVVCHKCGTKVSMPKRLQKV